jgi:hypothetical protein
MHSSPSWRKPLSSSAIGSGLLASLGIRDLAENRLGQIFLRALCPFVLNARKSSHVFSVVS